MTNLNINIPKDFNPYDLKNPIIREIINDILAEQTETVAEVFYRGKPVFDVETEDKTVTIDTDMDAVKHYFSEYCTELEALPDNQTGDYRDFFCGSYSIKELAALQDVFTKTNTYKDVYMIYQENLTKYIKAEIFDMPKYQAFLFNKIEEKLREDYLNQRESSPYEDTYDYFVDMGMHEIEV